MNTSAPTVLRRTASRTLPKSPGPLPISPTRQHLHQSAKCLFRRRRASAGGTQQHKYQEPPPISFLDEKARRMRAQGLLLEAARQRAKEAKQAAAEQASPPVYTKKQLEALRQYYTPEQMEALLAGQEAVDPKDVVLQGRRRPDSWRLKYLDDLAELDTVLDRPVRKEVTQATRLRMINREEWLEETADRFAMGGLGTEELFQIVEDAGPDEIPAKTRRGLLMLKQWIGTPKEPAVRQVLYSMIPKEKRHVDVTVPPVVKEGRDPPYWMTFQDYDYDRAFGGVEDKFGISSRFGLYAADPLWMVRGKNKHVMLDEGMETDVAPEIPAFKERKARYLHADTDHPVERGLQRLSLQTGYTREEIEEFDVKTLVQHRISNQTKMGKIHRQYVLTIAGNGDGLVGVGEGKSYEMEDASFQAKANAIRNMKPIHRYENRTIYGELEAKVGGTSVHLSSRPPGFGLRTQHLIFEVARVAGIEDLAARVGRSRNPMNTVKATVAALQKQVLPEEIALSRGRKLVDVRKVYYGRTVS